MDVAKRQETCHHLQHHESAKNDLIYTRCPAQGDTTRSTHRLQGSTVPCCCCTWVWASTVTPSSAAMRWRNRASWRSLDTKPFFCSSVLLSHASAVDGLSDEERTPDHENAEGNCTRLARFCRVVNGRPPALVFASADDDLTAVSPGVACHRDCAEDLSARLIPSVQQR